VTNVSGAVEDRAELTCPPAAMAALASQSTSLTAPRGLGGGLPVRQTRNIDCMRRKKKTFFLFYSCDMRVPDVIGMVVNMELYKTLYRISGP
jgi:hypothetical protein